MNELVSFHIEASCLIAQILVPCLEFVETAPRMMSSTPRGKGMGLSCLYYVISKSFLWLDTRDCLAFHCTSDFCIFGKGKTRVLQCFLGFLWLYVFMVFLLCVICEFTDIYLHHFLSSFASEIKQMSDKGRIHQLVVLYLLVLFNFQCFLQFEEDS